MLPRSNEPLAVKDEAGIRVASVAEGYELKGEQVALALEPLVSELAVCFFDAYQEDPKCLRNFLTDCINNLRQTFRAHLDEITTNASTRPV